MSGSRKEKKSSSNNLESEVDQLLKAAEDHVLLNLKLNSHTKSSTHHPLSSSSSSSSYSSLDPDLTRRFEALRSTPTKSESVDVDHLSARFDALKYSLGHQEVLVSSSKVQESDGDDDEDDGGVSQKEVEKLMQWAMDAARLESASKTKDEIDGDDEDEEDDDEDSEEERKKKESNREGKGKPKKWYFF